MSSSLNFIYGSSFKINGVCGFSIRLANVFISPYVLMFDALLYSLLWLSLVCIFKASLFPFFSPLFCYDSCDIVDVLNKIFCNSSYLTLECSITTYDRTASD